MVVLPMVVVIVEPPEVMVETRASVVIGVPELPDPEPLLDDPEAETPEAVADPVAATPIVDPDAIYNVS
jgi:hypothetical protein